MIKKTLIYLGSCFDLSVYTGPYGNEIAWSLGTCLSNPVYESSMTISHTCCLVDGKYSLICMDSFGDGWNGAYITIQNQAYCDDFLSLSSRTVDVWIGSEGSTSSRMYSKYCHIFSCFVQTQNKSQF